MPARRLLLPLVILVLLPGSAFAGDPPLDEADPFSGNHLLGNSAEIFTLWAEAFGADEVSQRIRFSWRHAT